jgi:hypothetical protein
MRWFVVLTLTIWFSAPTEPQQGFSLPKNGNGLLDFCGPLVNSFDNLSVGQSTPGESHGITMFKNGWCAGQLQAVREMTAIGQLKMAMLVAVSKGDKNFTTDEYKEMIAASPENTCIPDTVNQEQLARVVVKWLRNNPERLHEPASYLTSEALHAAFSCKS